MVTKVKDGIKRYEYFELEEYLKKIKLNDNVKYHLEDIIGSTHEYFKYFKGFSDEEIDYYTKSLTEGLIDFTNQRDISNDSPRVLLRENLIYTKNNINNESIKNIHRVIYPECPSDYRTTENRMGYVDEKGNEYVNGYGPYAKDVNKYMNEFIKVFKDTYSYDGSDNPYVSSIILNLLISKIQPFVDGNKRTARVIQNLKFTDKINEIYGSNLKLSPVNINTRIVEFKPVFNKKFNNVEFNLENDTNDAINEWIDFYLNMVDDQLYYSVNNIKKRNSIYSLNLHNKHYSFDEESLNNGTDSIKRRLR